jgi:hypothetical protein
VVRYAKEEELGPLRVVRGHAHELKRACVRAKASRPPQSRLVVGQQVRQNVGAPLRIDHVRRLLEDLARKPLAVHVRFVRQRRQRPVQTKVAPRDGHRRASRASPRRTGGHGGPAPSRIVAEHMCVAG